LTKPFSRFRLLLTFGGGIQEAAEESAEGIERASAALVQWAAASQTNNPRTNDVIGGHSRAVRQLAPSAIDERVFCGICVDFGQIKPVLLQRRHHLALKLSSASFDLFGRLPVFRRRFVIAVQTAWLSTLQPIPWYPHHCQERGKLDSGERLLSTGDSRLEG